MYGRIYEFALNNVPLAMKKLSWCLEWGIDDVKKSWFTKPTKRWTKPLFNASINYLKQTVPKTSCLGIHDGKQQRSNRTYSFLTC
jgi:hypothetical protein